MHVAGCLSSVQDPSEVRHHEVFMVPLLRVGWFSCKAEIKNSLMQI